MISQAQCNSNWIDIKINSKRKLLGFDSKDSFYSTSKYNSRETKIIETCLGHSILTAH